MHKHNLKSHKLFKSKAEKTVILGGETDYCAERFGYRREINGISPLPCFQKLTPNVYCTGVWQTDYMPHNGLAAFATSTGSLYGWDPVAKGSTKYLGMLTVNWPCKHPCVIDGVYYWLYVSGSWMVKVNSEGKGSPVNIMYKLTSTVMHCGRLFGIDLTDNYMVRWSGYAINDFKDGIDNAGYVQLNPRLGKLLDLFVLNDKIVVVRERGITTLTTLGDARHMRLDLCDKHELGGIYEHSSIICGGQLYIYSDKGMYVYDGSTLKKAPFDEIMQDYVLKEPKVVKDKFIQYTATKDGVSYLFEYDTETGSSNPYAKGCYCSFFTENGDYCFSENYLGNLICDTEDPDRFWLSKPVTFNDGKPRVLKRLNIDGSGNLNVEITCDKRKLYVKKAGIHTFAERGNSFTFKVTGNGTVNSVTAEWEVRV